MRSVAPLLALLVAAPALPAAGESCVVFRLQAWGRPGHAASLDVHAAPHRLIHGLSALLPPRERGLSAVRVRALSAASRPNVKPPTSRAVVEVTAEGDPAEVSARVEALLEDLDVTVLPLPGDCRADDPPPASTAG